MAPCGPDFTAVAQTLGGIDCAAANPVVSVRNPLDLTNVTLPEVELTMLLLALAALAHAFWWWRRQHDPTGLVLCGATLVQVLILEPPLYFPDAVGLQDRLGLIFVHNVFTVQFLYDRLPLYIVALYPALTYPAYLIVRRSGILTRERPLVAAACGAVTFHALYEVFDGLGPQLRWWAWNPDAPTNTPLLGSVPLTSAVMFAAASPFGIIWALQHLVVRPRARESRLGRSLSGWSLVLRTVAVGLAGIAAMMVFALPYSLFGPNPDEFRTTRALVLWVELALLAVVAARAWTRRLGPVRSFDPPDLSDPPDRPDLSDQLDLSDQPDLSEPRGRYGLFGVIAAGVFLVVFAILWAFALPDALDARAGLTTDGAPVGSLPYVGLCAVVAVAILARSAAGRGVAPRLGSASSTRPRPSGDTAPDHRPH